MSAESAAHFGVRLGGCAQALTLHAAPRLFAILTHDEVADVRRTWDESLSAIREAVKDWDARGNWPAFGRPIDAPPDYQLPGTFREFIDCLFKFDELLAREPVGADPSVEIIACAREAMLRFGFREPSGGWDQLAEQRLRRWTKAEPGQ